MNNFEHAERLAELTAMGTHELALMVIRLERDVDAYQLSDELQVALRQRGERDALQQLNAALEREAALVLYVERLLGCLVIDDDGADIKKVSELKEVISQSPTTCLTLRDALKQAETLDELEVALKQCGYGDAAQATRVRANDKRKQAEGLSK